MKKKKKENSTQLVVVKPKKHILLKIFLGIFSSITIFVLTVFLTMYIYLNNQFGKVNYEGLKKTDIYIDDNIDKALSGYKNIVILGIDARADTFSRGNRSDCIMILSVNKSTHDVKIASVYRDTYLDIENHNLDKVTHAYSFGEAKLALNTLNKNLDLNISDYITINFDTVRAAVDCVGGVQVELDSSEVKYINGYIDSLNRQFHSSSANIRQPGTYNLDGVQALAYGRIRYTDGGDYKRTERMRDVFLSVFDKARNMNIVDLNKLLDIILPHVRTNITKKEILSVIPSLNSYHVTDNFGWPYNTSGKIINKVWYGVPGDLEADVSRLHKQLFNQDDYQVTQTVKDISDKIKSVNK